MTAPGIFGTTGSTTGWPIAAAPPSDCFIPDAVYFASNIGTDGPSVGEGTCIWTQYDAMGRMTGQTVRTGCSSCSYDGGAEGATCSNAAATRTDYTYTWDARSRLIGATKTSDVSGDNDIVMSYLYDIGGNRIVREKSDVAGGSIADIYQDVYLGGTERRQVQLQNQSGAVRSIATAPAAGDILSFQNVAHTRELHYAAGVRIEWDNDADADGIENRAPKIFLSLNNHLGSTSAVIDFETGDLVEWNTNYAYGADESRWKNPNAKYADSEEPYGFTGKEEDKAVGLHYFGARYYSSYLGRWLCPDPPVIHGGGLSNHYNYGANSPYIYVDPDGNWAHLVIGAAVGGTRAGYNAARGGQTGGDLAWSVLKGSVQGFAGVAGGKLGSLYSMAAGMGMDMTKAVATGNPGDFFSAEYFKGQAVGLGISGISMAAGSFAQQAVSAVIGNNVVSMGVGIGVQATVQTALTAKSTNRSFKWEDVDDAMLDIAVNKAFDAASSRMHEAANRRQAGMENQVEGGGAHAAGGRDANGNEIRGNPAYYRSVKQNVSSILDDLRNSLATALGSGRNSEALFDVWLERARVHGFHGTESEFRTVLVRLNVAVTDTNSSLQFHDTQSWKEFLETNTVEAIESAVKKKNQLPDNANVTGSWGACAVRKPVKGEEHLKGVHIYMDALDWHPQNSGRPPRNMLLHEYAHMAGMSGNHEGARAWAWIPGNRKSSQAQTAEFNSFFYPF